MTNAMTSLDAQNADKNLDQEGMTRLVQYYQWTTYWNKRKQEEWKEWPVSEPMLDVQVKIHQAKSVEDILAVMSDSS